MNYYIRMAETNEASFIVELLNCVTLDLHKKNINQWTYPWRVHEIYDEIKNKHIYIIMKGHVIIGIFSLKDINENFEVNFIKSRSIYLYRIAILPEYQGKNIGKEIINYAYGYSENVNKPLYLNCFAGNEKLRSFYLKSGFDFCGDFPEEGYSISVFKYYN